MPRSLTRSPDGSHTVARAFWVPVFTLALIHITQVDGQPNANPRAIGGQQIVGALIDYIFQNSQGSYNHKPQCVPYPLPNGISSFQEWCQQLSTADDAYWDDVFRNASGPSAKNEPMPLHGCVLGCLVGKNSYQRGMNWGAGAWSGKCVQNSGGSDGVINILTPIPSIGGLVTVLNTFNWSTFLPTVEEYPGTVTTGASIWDALYSLSKTGTLSEAWVINYKDVQPPPVNANSSALEQTMNMYARLVQGSRDEVRQVAPGFMLGQVLRLPNSYLNPTPLPLNSGIRFALFQVCDSRGNYPATGNQRDLKPPS